MAIHKNAIAISKLWKMPLQFLQTLENATANCKLWKRHSRLRKMPLGMAWNGIFQSLEIAMAFLRNTRFGVAFIKLTGKKITGRAAGSLVSVARCAILSFIDYVDNGMGPRCQKSIRRSHFYWLEIRRHLLVYCHDLGGSLLSSSPRTIICWLCTRQPGRPASQPLNSWRKNTTHLKK